MADLPVSGGGGSQTTTQSPQTGASGNPGGTKSSNLQPGTSTSLLNGTGTVPLTQPSLPTIALPDLGKTQTTTGTAKETAKPPEANHANAALLGISLGVLLVALAVFYWAGRTDKNTTI
jgi:hypothetical protein